MESFLLCSSNGKGNQALTSFDDALRNSHIANYNLVKVSSILPAKVVRETKINLIEGSILHTAFAEKTTNIKGETISACVAVGIPYDDTKVGVIMEFADVCQKDKVIQIVKDMVSEAMNNRGYEIKEIIVVSAEAICDGKGYSTAFAALSMW